MKIWITTYALTKGILTDDVEPPNLLLTSNGKAFWEVELGYQHVKGRDWHRTDACALDRCKAMRDAKIESLEKQPAKLRAMTFEVKE